MFSLMDRIIDCLAEFKWLRSARVASRSLRQIRALRMVICSSTAIDIALFKIAFVPLIVKMKDVLIWSQAIVQKRYCRQLKAVRSENLCQVARTCESYCRCCHAVACDVRAWFSPAASGDHDQAGWESAEVNVFRAFRVAQTAARRRIDRIASCSTGRAFRFE